MTVEKTNLTVWDHIEDDLFSSVRGILQKDGYNFDVAEVVGWMADSFPFTGKWPAVGIVIGSETRDDHFTVAGRRCKRQVGIEMWVRVPKADRSIPAYSREYQKIVADLDKALCYGSAHTRGGYAEFTEFGEAQPVADAGRGMIGCFASVLITYRHKVGDLYTRL